MKIVIFILGCVFSSVAFYLLSYIGVFDMLDSVSGVEKEPNYSLPTYLSFISVMMTSVTVVLGALAFAIGGFSIYTVKEIREKAIEKATEEASKQVKKVVNPRNFHKIVMETMLNADPNKELDEKYDNDSQN